MTTRTRVGETVLEPHRLQQAKKAFTTRFAAEAIEADPGRWRLAGSGTVPAPGDVVLARVVELGRQRKLESPVSRRQTMFVGDEILVAYGNRYASDQYEAEVPGCLGPVQLVAAGGVASRVVSQHANVEDATRLEPVGLLADEHGVVNLAQHAPLSVRPAGRTAEAVVGGPGPTVIAVLGTSMNSGKSTTLACLARGLARAGYRVHAGKATGTGAGGDPRLFADAGAQRVLDFTDFGVVSTYRLGPGEVRDLFCSVLGALAAPEADGSAPDLVLVEVADGLYQEETSRLLTDAAFRDRVDHVVFSAGDALGAVAGAARLADLGLPVCALSGLLTASPLALRETAAAVDVPVLETYGLAEPAGARTVLESAASTTAADARGRVRVSA